MRWDCPLLDINQNYYYYYYYYYYLFTSFNTKINNSNKFVSNTCLIYAIHKSKEENLFYNLENIKNYNALKKSQLELGILVWQGPQNVSDFHYFVDWSKDVRDSDCLSTFCGWDKGWMEDVLFPRTNLNK